MSDDLALLVGGTGMLRDVGHELSRRRWSVVAVSRHPQRAVPAETGRGEFVPVAADWRDPESLVDEVLAAAEWSLATLAVVWVHSPYRSAVIRELERAIAPGGVVVQVWGSASQNPRDVMREELVVIPDRQMCNVILGYVSESNGSRWLRHSEIAHGVLQALEQPEISHLVGQIEPWGQRP